MTQRLQFDLFAPPEIVRPAALATDAVFFHGGRAMRVHKTYGTDAGAPVIVEELAMFGSTLRGQLGLWSVDLVRRAMAESKP